MFTPPAVRRTSDRMSSGVECSSLSTASSTSWRCGVSRYPRALRSLCQSVVATRPVYEAPHPAPHNPATCADGDLVRVRPDTSEPRHAAPGLSTLGKRDSLEEGDAVV